VHPNPGLLELQVDSVNSQCLNVSLAVHHFVKNLLCQNAEAADNGHICQLSSIFQRFVTHSRITHAAHQAVAIKDKACCV
jgi:hypothetical protein